MLSRWYRYCSAITELRNIDDLLREAEADLELSPGMVSVDKLVYFNERLSSYIAWRDLVMSELKPHLDYIQDQGLQLKNITAKISHTRTTAAALGDSPGMLNRVQDELSALSGQRDALIEKISTYKKEYPELFEKEEPECRL